MSSDLKPAVISLQTNFESKEAIEFFRRLAYQTEGSYQHIGRVRAEEDGLARAMLKALAPREADAAPGAPIKTTFGSSTGQTSSGGVLVRAVPSKGGACELSVATPKGLDAEVAEVARAEKSLFVKLKLQRGQGGTQTVKLDGCVPTNTAIRVAL